jgi:hypothetical protein
VGAVVFSTWMIFWITIRFDHRFLDNQVSELEDKEYQEEIKKRRRANQAIEEPRTKNNTLMKSTT